MADQWMSYADAASALGMSAEGVRQKARREAWRRQIGNDGKALILVPGDTSRLPPDDAAGDRANGRTVTGRTPAGRNADLEALQTRIVELHADLERERAERDRERSERLTERERADRLAGELTDILRQFATMAEEAKEAAVQRAVADSAQKAAEARIAAVRSELQAIAELQSIAASEAKDELASWRARPWWKRLAG